MVGLIPTLRCRSETDTDLTSERLLMVDRRLSAKGLTEWFENRALSINSLRHSHDTRRQRPFGAFDDLHMVGSSPL